MKWKRKSLSQAVLLGLQRLFYRVAEAVREEVSAERMYLYTFDSNQGDAHVHWHVVPLPPACRTRTCRGRERAGGWAC